MSDEMIDRARRIVDDERNQTHLGKWAEALLAERAKREESERERDEARAERASLVAARDFWINLFDDRHNRAIAAEERAEQLSQQVAGLLSELRAAEGERDEARIDVRRYRDALLDEQAKVRAAEQERDFARRILDVSFGGSPPPGMSNVEAIEHVARRAEVAERERDEAREHLAEASTAWLEECELTQRLGASLVAAEGERDALRAALTRHGEHDTTCDAWPHDEWSDAPLGPCTCGLDAALGEQEATPECTGLAATWCPVHGDCTCRPYGPGVADHKDDPTCPLHAPSSPHGEPVGEQEATPPECEYDAVGRCTIEHDHGVTLPVAAPQGEAEPPQDDDDLIAFFAAAMASCPYYLHYRDNVPLPDEWTGCGGCSDEPSCVTDEPFEGWPAPLGSGDVERWPGTTERPWFVEGLTAMDRFRSRVILYVGDSDQDRADLAMIVDAVNAYAASAPQGEAEPPKGAA